MDGIERVEARRGAAQIYFDSKNLKARDIIEFLKEETEFREPRILYRNMTGVTKSSEKVEARRMFLALLLAVILLFLTMAVPYIKHSVLSEPSLGIGKIRVTLYILLVALLSTVM